MNARARIVEKIIHLNLGENDKRISKSLVKTKRVAVYIYFGSILVQID